MRVLLVHGFNVRDGGRGTVGRLTPHLEGIAGEVVTVEYGWVGLLRVAARNRRVAGRLARLLRDGDVLVGHSNGCAIAHRAVTQSGKRAGLVFINPALARHTPIPPSAAWCDVYHCYDDLAAGPAAVLWRNLTRLLPWRWRRAHAWGGMGRHGYRGPADGRVRNVRLPGWTGHSGIFRSEALLSGVAAAIGERAQ